MSLVRLDEDCAAVFRAGGLVDEILSAGTHGVLAQPVGERVRWIPAPHLGTAYVDAIGAVVAGRVTSCRDPIGAAAELYGLPRHHVHHYDFAWSIAWRAIEAEESGLVWLRQAHWDALLRRNPPTRLGWLRGFAEYRRREPDEDR